MMSASEFLVRVRPLPDGGFEATCHPATRSVLHMRPLWFPIGIESDGHGSTPLAAMIAALSPGALKRAEAAIKRVWPELPADAVAAVAFAALANSQVQDITATQAGQ